MRAIRELVVHFLGCRRCLRPHLGFLLAGGCDKPKAAGERALSHGDRDSRQPGGNDHAIGTIEPEEVVEVGSQVVGVVTSFGPDPHAPASRSTSARGSKKEPFWHRSTTQNTRGASSTLARVACLPTPNWHRRKPSWNWPRQDGNAPQDRTKGKSISTSDLDVAKRTCETAEASVAVAEAALVQSKVALKQAEIKLGYTRIRSPVKGVVINRCVNLGETVAPSGNTPDLFSDRQGLEEIAGVGVGQ